jgi:hypothetical protein
LDFLRIQKQAVILVNVLARRVAHANVLVKFKIDESEKCQVKLHESANDLVVDVEGQPLIEAVRGHPSNILAHELHLEVDALDGQEALLEALGDGAVVHPLGVQFLRHLNVLLGDGQALVLGEVREEGQETKRIVKVLHRVCEGGIPLLDDVAEGVARHLLLQLLRTLELLLALQLLVFLQMGLDVPELGQQGIMLQDLQVLQVEVGLVAALQLLLRLPWVNTFQNAQAAEVLQGQLQTTNRIRPRDVLGGRTLGASLYFTAHFLECFLIID